MAGPIGVRAEIGDDIYFLNGAHNKICQLACDRCAASKLGCDFRVGGLSEADIFWFPSNRMIRMLVW